MDLKQEQQLIKDAQNNMQAFAALYDHYFPKIYAYCLNRIPLKEAAEDITSQVFIKSIEIVKQFDFKKSPRLGPWLYAVAHNLIIDLVRKDGKLLSFDETLPDSPTHDGSAEFEKQLELTQLQKQIRSVLPLINERYAQIISLKYYSELSTREIAQAMNVKPSQVPVILYRALEAFREKYKQRYPNSEIYYSF